LSPLPVQYRPRVLGVLPPPVKLPPVVVPDEPPVDVVRALVPVEAEAVPAPDVPELPIELDEPLILPDVVVPVDPLTVVLAPPPEVPEEPSVHAMRTRTKAAQERIDRRIFGSLSGALLITSSPANGQTTYATRFDDDSMVEARWPH
jgi:hypothetical protein